MSNKTTLDPRKKKIHVNEKGDAENRIGHPFQEDLSVDLHLDSEPSQWNTCKKIQRFHTTTCVIFRNAIQKSTLDHETGNKDLEMKKTTFLHPCGVPRHLTMLF